jgi:ATP-dependent Lon protease
MTSAGELLDRPGSRDPLRALSADQLCWRCPPLHASGARPQVGALLGQSRPLQALRTGLELRAPGYHVFVSGLVGTGRTALVKSLLEELRPNGAPGPDRVYLNDFRHPHAPRLLTLPRGRGPSFQRDLAELTGNLREALRAGLNSRPHKMSRRLVMRTAEVRQRRLLEALGRHVERRGCALVQYETQPGSLAADIYPIHANETLSPQALGSMVVAGALAAGTRDDLLARREGLLERLEEVHERLRRTRRRTQAELKAMDLHVAARVIEAHCREFRARWPQPEVQAYLDEVRECIERDLDRWTNGDAESERPAPLPDEPEGKPAARAVPAELHEFCAHVVHTCPEDSGRPVVVETSPTYANLIGTIEPPRDGLPGGLAKIHGGALLRADGGYLVLRAADVLAEPGVWAQLKRALRSSSLEIREYDAGSGTTVGILQPQAIPLDIKVVMIGEPGVYETLAAEDPQFLQTFKVHAEFDTTVPADAENLQRYADFLAVLAQDERLHEFSPEAAAAIAEFGARRAGRRDRLTTRFSEVADLAREASLACERVGQDVVRRQHVQDAWHARDHRADLSRELVERDLRDGYLLVHGSGRAVGQVNSLTVIDTGTFAFGKPCRITASTGVGQRGRSQVLNIERESALSGPLHDKGVLILGGFLIDRFAQDGPLCLQAAICFEQSYGGVDGDSASSAELYALLSSLAKVPLDQGIGITGSVNQKGQIQAVHAVNEKIEGFFRLCRASGWSQGQGVLIPTANVDDLMLGDDVVAAVRAGRFHVWAIDRIEEALRILTGLPAEEVMGRAAATLAQFREHAA